MANQTTVDPRDFIVEPFIACPACNKPDYGVLSPCVGPDSFDRRCRQCWHTQSYVLPKVHKTIIYLDQFAVSNLMHVRENTAKQLLPFWRTLYAKLLNLSLMQLVVCPASSAHNLESVVASKPEQLADASEMFSHRASFIDFYAIESAQVLDCLSQWIIDDYAGKCKITRKNVMRGNPDEWTTRIRFSVNLPAIQGYVPALVANTKDAHEALVEVFTTTWKTQPNQTWEHWHDAEAHAYGKGQLTLYSKELQKWKDISSGRRALSGPFDNLVQPVIRFFQQMAVILEKAGIPQNDIGHKLVEFMLSEALCRVPFVRISSSLCASLAKKAAHQQKPPTRGFFSDVDMISCLLPYCDAMLVDRECCAYWNEIQQSEKRRLPYTTRVFSLATKDEFLAYLDEIEASATPEHRQAVKDVYNYPKN